MSVPATHGYYRYPTLCKDSLIFTCEDDLWHVPVSGGTARRITSGLAECAFPALSPDGSLVAFTGREDGQPEVYVMPTEGGHPKRLTYLGGQITRVLGWHDGRIIFTTNARQAFLKFQELHAVSPDGGGEPVSLGLGHGMSISFGHGNRAVIGRNSADAARWKRYKGGTAGDIWIDASGHGQFSRLNQAMNLRGNLISPIWMTTKQGDRIYFVSDHEGVANFYSVSPEGTALRRHTHHSDYFVRYPQPDAAGDGKIVYHAGADLYTLDTATDTVTKVDVAFHSPQTQRGRKFVSASQFLEDYFLHPEGHSLALTSRGKFFTAAVNEGPATQFGTPFHQGHAVRYRLAQYLHDGERVAVLSDASGEEALEIYGEHNRAEHQFDKLDVGRAILMLASPKTNHVLITNHRQEVLLVDVDKGTLKQIDHSSARRIESAAWSPDGRYIAYPLPLSNEKAAMKIYDVEAGVAHTVTEPLLTDFAPSFTPDGNYLCLLSQRVFDPVYDNLHFDLNFPKGTKPYLLPLRSRLASPFLLSPKPPAKSPVKPDGNGSKPNGMKANDINANGSKPNADGTHAAETAPNDVPGETKYEIEFDGILQRLVEFPVVEGRYEQLAAGHTKIFFSHFPIEGAMKLGRSTARTDGTLSAFNFAEKKTEVIAEGITDFKLSADARTLAYRAGEKLVVVSADEPSVPAMFAAMKPPEKPFDFSRLKLAVEPVAEWQQMYREAWRLQRDQFWTPDMSGVDWPQVYERYLPLISRVASRSEFSDVMWEMQGELGTSHCYEQGGDYRPEPKYFQGLLGAEINFDVVKNTYRITSIVRGDSWDEGKDSPLAAPGVGLKSGDVILAVNGQRASQDVSLGALLVNQAGNEVALTVASAVAGKGEADERIVRIKPLRDEQMLYYRAWVNRNTALVHSATGGKVGYVHVPNMGPWGYSEFFRAYLTESALDAMIVDVRFNGGGHVSQLLLEKLGRKRLGYDITRWAGAEPYPSYSILGPVVALTNEFAGSDGDIFSHCFKMMNLGTLIGKRTWGGVVGIHPRHALADGSITTQPEFSFWFHDVGWAVENYGTDPHIEVDLAPQDYAAGRDAQLERAIAEIQKQMQAAPPALPVFAARPNLALPKLPAA